MSFFDKIHYLCRVNLSSILFMKRILLLLIISTVAVFSNAQNVDSLYARIDDVIANSDKYMSIKNKNIQKLKNEYRSANNLKTKYQLGYSLFEEYHALMNDSAIAYLNRCIDIATQLRDTHLQTKAYIAIGRQFAASGFYPEAINYFSKINEKDVDADCATDYYYGYTCLYGEMGYYTKDYRLKQQYFNLSNKYNDILYRIIDKKSDLYLQTKSTQLCNQKKYQEALSYNNRWLANVKPGTHDYAIVAFFRSEIYKATNNVNMQKYWLAQSALCDIQCAVMDQSSLWSLADIVNREGDVERSYKYIEYSWKCLSTFNSHMRGWLVSPILTMISNNYKEKLKTANRNLLYMIAIISMLSVFLAISLIYVRMKENQLRIARNKLSDINAELKALNEKLKDANSQLSTTNMRLNDSNRVKDEYIGKFLSICSEYIDKLDNYRIKVNRKVKSNQFKELLVMTNSQQLKEDELKELFDNFDTVFLRLFPNFTDEFNALLKPEDRIELTENGKLTTDLRIFALIRLGIDESSRIAEFLRYSPNSIYNYRARIKKKALCGRDDFEKRIMEIGMERNL